MNMEIKMRLTTDIRNGGYAYLRNLAAAEAAVLNGQFNVAKILRASAHSQRVMAMEAARLLAENSDVTELLETILSELDSGLDSIELAPEVNDATKAKLERLGEVRAGLQGIIQRSLDSLTSQTDVSRQDVLESDVAQFLWGCYSCGYIAEGDRPDFCPICGALGIEFEWFGPFYLAPTEHLGQLAPTEILTTLEMIPDQIADTISTVSDDILERKPSDDEWSIKEIVGHIIETDLLFSQRLRVLLEGQGIPVIPRSAPPWKLHEGKGYETLSVDQLLKRLREARSTSLELVSNLEAEHWTRQGTLLGTIASVLDLGSWLANHDRGHLAQIRQLCSG